MNKQNKFYRTNGFPLAANDENDTSKSESIP
jgi:hypothetical protein